MATGLPVVASAVGGNPELVSQGVNGCLFPSDNKVVLAETICQLLSKEDLRQTMGSEARKMAVKYFTLERMIQDYAVNYERVAALGN
jgi:glycosyltransferase involved in cell wall biosynthesis